MPNVTPQSDLPAPQNYKISKRTWEPPNPPIFNTLYHPVPTPQISV